MDAEVLRERWERVRAGLNELIDRLQAGELEFAPFVGSWDVGTLLRHIAHEEEIEVTWGLRRAVAELPAEPSKELAGSIDGICALLERVHEGTRQYLAGLTDRDLESEVEIAWGGRVRPGEQLWHVLEHEVHHRGELSLILGMLGRGGIDV